MLVEFSSDLKINNNIKYLYYLHIPKTGGTYVIRKGINYKQDQIEFINLAHSFGISHQIPVPFKNRYIQSYLPIPRVIHQYSLKKLKSPRLIISVVRNPFDLLLSYYCHHGSNKGGWDDVNKFHSFKKFDDFVRGFCDNNFEWHHPALNNFLFSQMFDSNGYCAPDLIIRYEYLNEALDKLNKHLGVKLFLIYDQKFNASVGKPKDYKKCYNKELRYLVEQKCRRELEIFGYDFNGPIDKHCFIYPKKLKYLPTSDLVIDERNDEDSKQKLINHNLSLVKKYTIKKPRQRKSAIIRPIQQKIEKT